ncbi:MAG: tetratricopeptide repeat protein [Chloroflexota bacterium]
MALLFLVAKVEQVNQQAHTLAQALNDQAGLGATLYTMGRLAAHQLQYEVAEKYMQQSLVISRRVGDTDRVISRLNYLGLISMDQGIYQAAADYYEQSLTAAQAIGSEGRIAMVLTNLGILANSQGDYEMALYYAQQSLAIDEKLSNQSSTAIALINLGDLARLHGDYEAARDYALQSIAIQRRINNNQHLGVNFHNLGEIAKDQGQYDTAYDYYQQSLANWQELDALGLMLYFDTGVGSLWFEQGAYEKAHDQLQVGLQKKLAGNIVIELGINYGYLVLCQVALTHYEAAFQTVLDHFQRLDTIDSDDSFGLVSAGVGQLLAAQELGHANSAQLASALDTLTQLTQLAATPTAYFEAALRAAKPHFARLRVLMEYGRYLGQTGQVEAGRVKLSEAKAMAEASHLDHKVSEIETLIQAHF